MLQEEWQRVFQEEEEEEDMIYGREDGRANATAIALHTLICSSRFGLMHFSKPDL